jgi:hypothetical protein
MKLIDFTNYELRVNEYDGAEAKTKIVHDGSIYMLKFGDVLESDKNKPLQGSYSNMPVAEHVGSRIFNLLGIPAQETILGTYEDKYAVACKDFLLEKADWPNFKIVPFKSLEKSFLGSSSQAGRTPAYENVIDIFNNHKDLETIREKAISRYWEMFIGDALISNFDRHAGNWGYILNRQTDEITDVAPVYDCGSSFYPKLSLESMKDFLNDEQSLHDRVLDFPYASLMVNGKKIRYHDFLLTDEGAECRRRLVDLYPRIDVKAICEEINSIADLPQVQKDFYCRLIEIRKDLILKPAYEYLSCNSYKNGRRSNTYMPYAYSKRDDINAM